jgi:hypothetical protein
MKRRSQVYISLDAFPLSVFSFTLPDFAPPTNTVAISTTHTLSITTPPCNCTVQLQLHTTNMGYCYSKPNSSSGTDFGKSPPQTRLIRRSYVPSEPPNSERSQSRRHPSASPASSHLEARNDPPTTVYIVPHYAFGDPNPFFASKSNLNLPTGFEHLRANLGKVYDDFRSEDGHDDPDGMRKQVSAYLTEVNEELSARRKEEIRKGVLPSNAEAVELRLAPKEDYKELRGWINGLSLIANEKKDTNDRSEYGKAEDGDLSQGEGCPPARARFDEIYRKLDEE